MHILPLCINERKFFVSSEGFFWTHTHELSTGIHLIYNQWNSVAYAINSLLCHGQAPTQSLFAFVARSSHKNGEGQRDERKERLRRRWNCETIPLSREVSCELCWARKNVRGWRCILRQINSFDNLRNFSSPRAGAIIDYVFRLIIIFLFRKTFVFFF